MSMEELTIKQCREIVSTLESFGSNQPEKPNPFRIGSAYFIRTVTYHCTGVVDRIEGDFLVMTSAAMIADSKRFFDFLTNWKDNSPEIEPFPNELYVNMGAITDATIWDNTMPSVQL